MSDNSDLSGNIEWLLAEGEHQLFQQLAETSSKYLCRISERETLRPQLEEQITRYNRLAEAKGLATVPLDRAVLFAKDITAYFFENRTR